MCVFFSFQASDFEAHPRICLEEGGDLIQPCACEGSMRWVHAECLAEWWKHRQQKNDMERVISHYNI